MHFEFPKKKSPNVNELLKELESELSEDKSQPSQNNAPSAKKPFIPDKNIYWLNEMGKDDIPIAGGKGANLAEMYNIGLPVPPAFVVTATAYKKFVQSTDLFEKIMEILKSFEVEDTAVLEDKAAEIRALILKQKMPIELEEEIKEAYENLNVDPNILKLASNDVLNIIKTAREPVFVAVRSSATTEDLKGASFAGQQETFLNIKGFSALLDSIKRCWASLFTARAVYYRTKQGFKHDESFIAVVVQKMVNSDKSGVIFTINPVTNNKQELVMEAVFGLGEGIVSGTIAPDRYSVDKEHMKITDRFVAFKPIYFTRSSNGNTIKANLPSDKVNEQVLENYEILKLTNYALDIEEHYKSPQDIEWAVEYGKVYILQTRPITTVDKEIRTQKIEIKESSILEGLSASPGVTFGTVRIVHSISELSKVQTGDILVTEMTNPDMVVSMQKAAAIITDEGGQTCHAAIVSRELGIPAIVGTRKATKVLKEGQIITVDAYSGKVYDGKVEGIEKPAENAPHKELELPEMDEKVEDHEELTIELPGSVPEEMSSQREIQKTKVYMNLGEPDKIDKYKNLPFDGIGLMRLEFVIASEIGKHPLYMIEIGEQNKYINLISKGVEKVAEAIYPKPVIIRFSDFKSNEYRNLEGGKKYETRESNPMIGFRGVSRYISEEFQPAFRLECKAILETRKKHDNVWIMLPFVRTVEEVTKCLQILSEEGLTRSETFKIFLMAEVPAMAIIPDEFAKLPIDGVSIGSNDLTQLVLGVDRDSGKLGMMGYFDERNKAVLKALYNIITEFHKHGKTVSICGQAPSVYPEMAEFLLKEKIDSLSVNPDVVEATVREVERFS